MLFHTRYKPQNYPVENQYLQRLGSNLFRVGVASMQGFRDSMEDAHATVLQLENHTNTGFFGVYDGHNGTKASDWCSQNVHLAMNQLKDFSKAAIQQTTIELDAKYLEITNDRVNGSTAVFAILQKLDEQKQTDGKTWKLIISNLGDSRCIVSNYKSPTVDHVTTDHKPGNTEEAERIKAAGGFVACGRIDACLAVARAFGDHNYKNNKSLPPEKQKVISVPDVIETYLTDDNFVLLCCDGIFESFSTEKVVEFIHEGFKHTNDITMILSNLLKKVLLNGSRDNMTAMLIQLKNGVDYNSTDQFIPGEWYPAGNDSYTAAFKNNCEKYGKTTEEVKSLWFKQKELLDKEKPQKKQADEDDESDSDEDDESESESSG